MPRPSARRGQRRYVEAELDVPDGFFDDEELAGARGAAAGGRARARDRAACLRRRPHACVRVGSGRGARGRRDGGRAADRDVRPVRAAPARAAVLPARRSRRVLRRRAAGAPTRRTNARGASSSPRDAASTSSRRDADAVASRIAELQALVDATEGMEPGDEQELLTRRERLRHVEELAEAASVAAAAIAPDEGDGAAAARGARRACRRTARAHRARACRQRGGASRPGVRLREVGSDLHRFVASLDCRAGSAREHRGATAGARGPQAALRRLVLRRAARAGRRRRARAGRRRRGRRPGRGRSSRRRTARRAARSADRGSPRRARGKRESARRGRRRRARVARDGGGRVPRRAT